jgi:hypothetical protein
MGEHAESTASVTAWDENAYWEGEDGAKLTKATIGQALSGELEGETTAEMLMCYRPDGTASFLGQQRVEGTLGGRSGAFTLHSTGTFEGGEARSALTVVEGSGTGELAGLRGTGTAVAGSDMKVAVTLDYELE